MKFLQASIVLILGFTLLSQLPTVDNTVVKVTTGIILAIGFGMAIHATAESERSLKPRQN